MALGADQLRGQEGGNAPGAAPAARGRHRDVLHAADLVGDGEAHHRGAQPTLPEHLAGAHVVGADPAVEVAGKDQPSRRGQRGGQEGRALLDAPHLLQRRHVVGGQLAEVAARAGHLHPGAVALVAPGTWLEHRLAPGDLHAALAEGRDQQARLRVISAGGPVVATGGRGADGEPFVDFGVGNIVSILDGARIIVDIQYILIDGFREPEKTSVPAVQLPQDAVLADGDDGRLAVHVQQHALQRLVHVQRLAGHMDVVPGNAAVLDAKGEGGVGVGGGVGGGEAPARGHPRLGLRGAEVDEPELGIPAARHPDIGSPAQLERQTAPGVAAGLAGTRDGVGAPELAARARVVGGDEAALLVEAAAAVDAVDDLAVGDNGPRAVRIALLRVGDARLPAHRAGGRVQRHHVRVGGGHVDHVLPDGQGAQLTARPALEAPPVFPQGGAVGRVQRLHDVAGVAQEEDTIAHQGGLLAPAVLHAPRPGELQAVHVGGVDLVERAVPPRPRVAAPVQPVARGGVGQVGVRGWGEAGGAVGTGRAGGSLGQVAHAGGGGAVT